MFTLQVIISFVVGGSFIALQTLFGERVPLRWRGAILTLPSTMAISFLFIGLAKSASDVTEVAIFFPAGIAIGFIFVLVFSILSKYSLTLSLIGSLIVWIITAGILITYPPQSFFTASFIYALPIILMCYFLIIRLPQFTNITPVKFTVGQLMVRALIGGSIIALSVVLSKTLGNIWGSLFSAFPAVFSSTLLIYTIVHGKKVIPSVARSLFFPGPIVLILYAGIAGLAFPMVGIWYGTLLSYVGVAVFYILLFIIQQTMKIPSESR